MSGSRFAFAPGVVLSVDGRRGDVRELGLEYDPVRVAGGADATLVVQFVRWGSVTGDGPRLETRHKSMAWSVALSPAEARPVTLDVALRGAPRGVVRSMVQGYFVEPLLSVVAAEAGQLLLPAAGIVAPDGLRILVGKSGAGKSTLAARALAAGRTVIGDDQVLVDATGAWLPYPRRLRFYPDLRVTAPRAWAALPARTRATLRLRGLVDRVSRGFVRPSLRVAPQVLGWQWDPAPRRAARIVLLERSAEVGEVTLVPGDAGQALAWAATVLADQRSRLRRIDDPGWQARLDAIDAREQAILASAIDGLPVDVVRIPAGWPAPRAIAATERRLGLASG